MLDTDAIRAAYSKLVEAHHVQRVTRNGNTITVLLNSRDNVEMLFTINECDASLVDASLVDRHIEQHILAWQKRNVLRVANSLLREPLDIKA